MRYLVAVFVLLLASACQAPPPPEMTDAEIAQIEAEVLEAIETNFEGFRQLNLEMALEPVGTDISWVVEFGSSRLFSDEGSHGEHPCGVLKPTKASSRLWQIRVSLLLKPPWSSSPMNAPSHTRMAGLFTIQTTSLRQTFLSGSQMVGKSPSAHRRWAPGVRIDPVFGTYDFSRLNGIDLPNDGSICCYPRMEARTEAGP